MTGGKSKLHSKQRNHVFDRETDRLHIQALEEGNIINTKTMTYETEQKQDDNP